MFGEKEYTIMIRNSFCLSCAALLALTFSAIAQHPILPFAVTIGGQKAEAKGKDAIFAVLEKEIAADAAVELKLDKPTTIFINVFPCDENGTAVPGAKTAVIMAQNATKTKLDATLDKSTLKPGTYVSNIIAAGKTARVLFKVKK